MGQLKITEFKRVTSSPMDSNVDFSINIAIYVMYMTLFLLENTTNELPRIRFQPVRIIINEL
jgi:hypothetical protein